jgi:hypothetical protein
VAYCHERGAGRAGGGGGEVVTEWIGIAFGAMVSIAGFGMYIAAFRFRYMPFAFLGPAGALAGALLAAVSWYGLTHP